METAGSKKAIGEFLTVLLENPPFNTKINNIKIKSECYEAYNSLSIINSSTDNQLQGFIPPDTAICDECIKEIQDKMNPRYMYRQSAHEMLAVLGGKAPHNHGVFIGGITTQETADRIIKNFLCNPYLY